jgi:dipeptidyl aminopeptidase/acylaminoacyl peptidase
VDSFKQQKHGTGLAPRAETGSVGAAADTAEMGQSKCETPYGAWKSPLTADVVSGSQKRFGGAAIDSDGRVLWLEGRPSEAGRVVLVREGAQPGSVEDITPAGFSVRTVVHEYGGGAFAVKGDNIVFSNYADQRLYKQSIRGDRTPVPLTPAYENKAVRYADGDFDDRLNRIIVVREDNRQEGVEAVNEIVAVDLSGDANLEPKVLVKGNHFYMSPRLSPDCRMLAWVEWSHPNMPWDQTSVWVGTVSDDGSITDPICIAGGDKGVVEAPIEPKWSPKGDLIFASDRGSGFWNLYSWSAGSKVQALCPLEAEFARPPWIFGLTSSGFFGDSGTRIICTCRAQGISHLAVLDLSTGSLAPIKTRFTDITNVYVRGKELYISGGSPTDTLSLVKVSVEEGKEAAAKETVLWSSISMDLEKYKPYFSTPRVVEFDTAVEGETAFANYYPPANGDFVGPAGERPPLLVRSHGGPTSDSSTNLDFGIQYWTSRGWAFVDVNYGGSTGYGRAYRERLYGQWGIVDVNDCCSCAEFLVKIGEVDPKRLCISGGSAGGYTTMAALVFKDVFTAGASLYGISDLKSCVADTHKFESRYLAGLLGPDDVIEQMMYDRSPINFLEKLSCPLILFQGLEDKVVPPNQARMVYDAVKAKGIPVAVVEYEGEQHGFRKAENIRNTLEQQMVFFARLVGGFQVADDIVPIKVENFDK